MSALNATRSVSDQTSSGIRRVDTQHPQQHSRRLVGVDAGVLEKLVHGHVENARGVVGALDVSTDPVQRFGVARQHQ